MTGLSRRIIPCLDVRGGLVVKGRQFRHHEVVGHPVELARRYARQGADELVFYDITASGEGRSVDRQWVRDIARELDIPFCVAGGLSDVRAVQDVLSLGADKVSVNSPALLRPELISELVSEFGQQCVVVGVDSYEVRPGVYQVYQLTGSESATRPAGWNTADWVQEAVSRGAGEIVLNCMNQDGMRQGYDVRQLAAIRRLCPVPLIASGGPGQPHISWRLSGKPR
ncbi:imidazole glycerol phosphate synthase subunit HisF [Deinococcus lacus]|uniref:imidazole glycerol-phosphate synthase n=1 Tax=Deinococcus lacus TaxID=392561 RepID=A0ABW1YF82_9DEIO